MYVVLHEYCKGGVCASIKMETLSINITSYNTSYNSNMNMHPREMSLMNPALSASIVKLLRGCKEYQVDVCVQVGSGSKQLSFRATLDKQRQGEQGCLGPDSRGTLPLTHQSRYRRRKPPLSPGLWRRGMRGDHLWKSCTHTHTQELSAFRAPYRMGN